MKECRHTSTFHLNDRWGQLSMQRNSEMHTIGTENAETKEGRQLMDDDGTFGMVVELSGKDSLDVFRLSRKDLVGVRQCWDCEEVKHVCTLVSANCRIMYVDPKRSDRLNSTSPDVGYINEVIGIAERVLTKVLVSRERVKILLQDAKAKGEDGVRLQFPRHHCAHFFGLFAMLVLGPSNLQVE